MKKLVSNNQKNWHKKLHEALWVDRVTPKKAIGIFLFIFVCGVEASLPLPLELSICKLQQEIKDPVFQSGLKKYILYLTKLEDESEKLVDHITKHQKCVKRFFNKR